MSSRKVYFPIKVLSLISLVVVAVDFWEPYFWGFYFKLSPYVILYFLAKTNNYRNAKLATIRSIPAFLTFILVPFLLFGIESDPQAAIWFSLGILLQLSSISAAELVIFFFVKDEKVHNKSINKDIKS